MHHWCLAVKLRIGNYNGEMVFNRLLGNGWLDLDDLFGKPQWNFNSNKMVKNQPSSTSARPKFTLHVQRIFAYFGPDWLRFLWWEFFPVMRNSWNFQRLISNARGTFESVLPTSTHLQPQNMAENLTEGVKKTVKKFVWPFLSRGRLNLWAKWIHNKSTN